MWKSVETLLGGLPGSTQEGDTAKKLSTLPLRLGGLGLRSAERTAPAAYWASWADALAMVNTRAPQVAAEVVADLQLVSPQSSGLAEL